MNGRNGRLYYGWYIVGAGFLILALGYGSRYSFSVFFPALLAEFNWPRDLAASILSTHLLFYGLTAPLAGHFVDRFGPRRTMLSGTVLLAAGLAVSGLGGRPWHFFLSFGVLAGLGLCLLASCPLTVLIRNWFERRRGTAIALIFFGEGAAYACYPGVVWLIGRFGWRSGFLIIGLLVALVFIPLIVLVMVARPEQKGLHRDGGRGGADPAGLRLEQQRVVDRAWAETDWTVAGAARTRRFYLLCFAAFSVWGLSHHIVVTHQIALALDAGFSAFFASAVIALGGPAFGLGSLASLVSDRLGRETTLFLGTAAALSGLAALIMIRDTSRPWLLYYFATAFNFGFGICVPTVAAAATDVFQGPRVGAVIGFIWFSFALGGAAGPWLGGFLFELFDDYVAAVGLAGVVLAAGSAAVWLAAPRKVRLVPGRVGR